ncbi:bifunctional diguanylate cyclase/phosphodiesterase [Aureimonas sp. Leaf454]|uniref:putative bifunctional diguanylate cyclase/phosphodiesterase n=1 Tax=Aureimonas sp. Leaf454 TaxID=1736381 RepID=UPI001FCCE6A2|nr:bifunctional diguanylate cyclase/phosphodiesterase [Aureimonas sp. Leaf454]
MRQLQAVDQLIPAMMVANVICSGALMLLLFEVQPVVLSAWFGLIALASLWRLFQAVRKSPRSNRRWASSRAVRKSTRQAFIMAACFMSVPAWLLTQTSDLPFASIVCLITGMLWAGGLVLNSVPSAAVVYICVVSGMTIAGLLAKNADRYHFFLCFLFLIGGATVIRSVLRHARLFIGSQLQQIDLEDQSELIGVLLKDYEEQASDWLWETDADLRYKNVSDRFAEALGRSPGEIERVAFGSLLVSDVPGNPEARLLLRAHARAHSTFRDVVVPFDVTGDLRWWSISGRSFFDETGAFSGYRGVCADITATKRAETRIAHLAHHDALTDLPNRALFSAKLDEALAEGGSATRIAVLSLDLDGFKAVNDRYGHPAGDTLLTEVAGRLRRIVERGDLVARFGGDEFVILRTAFTQTLEVETFAERLIAALRAPFAIEGDEVSVGVSIGVAFAPFDGQTSESLLRNVDAALYRAKEEGRGTYRFFAAEMDHTLQERRRLIQDLRLAIARNELVLYFQPYVGSETGLVTGCEALLRWRHPDRGMIAPAEFIPLAEESGLIVDIGAWVIEEACREAATWPDGQRISVNVSPLQFRDRELPKTILAALASSGLSPSRLEVEVTETVLVADASGALDILRQVRALGVRIALDDFGTGYSSLSYLRTFPFDKIKIDKSFVDDLAERRDTQVIVQAIRDIAEGLGMSITAEGVETLEQATHLRETGCHELQGYLYSRPKPAAELSFERVNEPRMNEAGTDGEWERGRASA